MPIPVRHTPAPPRRFNPRTRMVRRSNGRRTSPGRPARGSRTPRQPSAVPSIGPLPNAAVAAGLLLADGPSAAPDHSTETDQTSSPSTARSSSVGQQRHRFDQRSTFRSTLLTASATGQQPRGQNDCSTVLLWLSTLRRPARATPARQLRSSDRHGHTDAQSNLRARHLTVALEAPDPRQRAEAHEGNGFPLSQERLCDLPSRRAAAGCPGPTESVTAQTPWPGPHAARARRCECCALPTPQHPDRVGLRGPPLLTHQSASAATMAALKYRN